MPGTHPPRAGGSAHAGPRSRRRLEGAKAIVDALERGAELAIVLCREGAESGEHAALIARLVAQRVLVRLEPAREMRRMSSRPEGHSLLALEGAKPPETLDALMVEPGLVLALAGLRYPGNVGFILRSAEVAGAAGVVIVNDWAEAQHVEARRIGMHANRFFGVLEASAQAVISAARRAGRRLVAVETEGDETPWRHDWTHPALVVVGGETFGLAPEWLEAADAVVRIPSHGFIPSYNVQAAVGMVLGEWLRQTTVR